MQIFKSMFWTIVITCVRIFLIVLVSPDVWKLGADVREQSKVVPEGASLIFVWLHVFIRNLFITRNVTLF